MKQDGSGSKAIGGFVREGAMQGIAYNVFAFSRANDHCSCGERNRPTCEEEGRLIGVGWVKGLKGG